MSFNGSGSYSLPAGNPVVTGAPISSTWANLTLNDIASALTNTLCKDGQSTPSGNLKMGGYKFTGLAAGTAAGDSARFEQLFSQGAPTDIASAATVDIGAQNTNFLTVTGTTTITSFGTNYNGPKMLRFSGALTLTHNATTLILPGAANITTAAGDTCIAIPKSTSSGSADGWTVLAYQKASGGVGIYAVGTAANNLVQLDGSAKLPAVDGSQLLNAIPAGAVQYFAMNTAPTGWLKANGAAVSRTTYATLFAAIGTTFGSGDGSTTFNLPDLRGEFMRAWDDSRGVDSGRVFGSAQSGSVGPHDHYTRAGNGSVSDNYGGSGADYGTNSSNLPVSTDGTTATTGPGIGAETRPRNIALLACIKF